MVQLWERYDPEFSFVETNPISRFSCFRRHWEGFIQVCTMHHVEKFKGSHMTKYKCVKWVNITLTSARAQSLELLI